MVSEGRQRDKLRRAKPKRDPRRRILIVCEGVVTEPTYFRAFQNERRHPGVHVETVGAGAVPLTVVERAIALRNEADERARAERAVSNPSFELWALLHFQDQTAHIERWDVASALRGHLPGYEKLLDYRRLHPSYEAARARAHVLRESAARVGKPNGNPTTDVDLVTDSITRDA